MSDVTRWTKPGMAMTRGSLTGNQRADVRQHTVNGLDLQRARPGPRRADEKKRKNKKKKKRICRKCAQSRPTQSVALRSKGFAGL